MNIWDFNTNDPNTPIDVNVLMDANNAVIEDLVDSKQLVMLRWEGMSWLIPYEIMVECRMLLIHRDKHEDSYNILSPVTITIQQCIPIPSETAKILLEL